jgi:2-alkenal reductase
MSSCPRVIRCPRVIGGAPEYDVAVVRLRNSPRDLQPLPIGTSKSLSVGQATYAIGNPFGLSRTLTAGIVNAVERRLPTVRGREVRGVVQTDAAINPGNSSGPLLNSSGRLIGVNTAIISESGSSAGIGFAIPVYLINRVVPQIITQGHAPLPGIGIAPADEGVAAQLGVRGVVVRGVRRGSPADHAGIRPFDPRIGAVGDIIIAADGQRTQTAADLAAVFEDAGVGTEVTLSTGRHEQVSKCA